jgi:hypothetical protein
MLITINPRTRRVVVPTPKLAPTSFKPDSLFRGDSPFFCTDGRALPLEGMYRGAALFLLCSGPSLRTHDLSLLCARGICTMAVNNAWLVHRPDFWVGVDSPSQFADTGWRDPSVLKFVPAAHLDRKLQTFDGTQIVPSRRTVRECPNVAAFRRHDGYDPLTFFDLPVCGWGTMKTTSCALGIRNTRSVMPAAIWIAVKLGFTSINLLGCDFNMPPTGPCYAFGQDKHEGGRASNNRLYNALNKRLAPLVPILKARGVSIWNANPASGLRCFAHRPFAEMLGRAAPYCRTAVPEGGWYK